MNRSYSYSLLFSLISIVSCGGIGDRLLHTYMDFAPLPLNVTAAESSGWIQATSDCDKFLGIAYSNPNQTFRLYFTSGGQIAGVGVIRHDQPIDNLVPTWWKPLGNGSCDYEVTLSFRTASTGIMCNGDIDQDYVLGESLWINQDGIAANVPLDANSAAEALWTSGGCVDKMGTHWAYDLKSAPVISHITSDLLPVVTMYSQQTGRLTSFFVHSNYVEQVFPFGDWEGPLNSSGFCGNFCPPCSWDSSVFSTLHFFVSDPSFKIVTNCW